MFHTLNSLKWVAIAALLAGCLGEAPQRFPTNPPNPTDTTSNDPGTDPGGDPGSGGDTQPIFSAPVVVDTVRKQIVVPGGASGKSDTLVYSTSGGKLSIGLPGGETVQLEGQVSNSGQPTGTWTVTPGSLPDAPPGSPQADWLSIGKTLLAEVPLTIGFNGSQMTVSLPDGYCSAPRMESALDSALSQTVKTSGCNSVKISHPVLPGVDAEVSFKLENNSASLVFEGGGKTCTFSQALLPLLLGAGANAQSATAFNNCLVSSGFTP